MASNKVITEAEYIDILKNAWDTPLAIEECFPEKIARWIKYHAILTGVPNSYISHPVLVTTAYCSQHAFVEVRARPKPASPNSVLQAMLAETPTPTPTFIRSEEKLIVNDEEQTVPDKRRKDETDGQMNIWTEGLGAGSSKSVNNIISSLQEGIGAESSKSVDDIISSLQMTQCISNNDLKRKPASVLMHREPIVLYALVIGRSGNFLLIMSVCSNFINISFHLEF